MKAFKRLNPKQKQMVVIGGALAGAMAVITVSMSNQPEVSTGRKAEDSIRHVLTDRDSREVTMGSLATQLTAAQQENKTLREEFERLQAEVAAGQSTGIPSAVTRELDGLSREIDLLREENRELRESTSNLDLAVLADLQSGGRKADDTPEQPDIVEEPQAQPEPDPQPTPEEPEETFVNERPAFGDDRSESLSREDIFAQRPVTRRTTPATPGEAGAADGEEGEAQPKLSITTYYQEDHPEDQQPEEEAAAAYLPSGSIVSGVLLNGIDAPTGQGARRDPFPVTIRVKKEAILPNHYSADVKECFMLVSGHGDLSTERAYLRGNNISCITDAGDPIETELRGYVVGEDGKAGLRGRLVSKQGAMIARSMVAGFFSGASQAFDVSPVPVINTTSNGSGQQEYQQNYSSDLLEGSAASGASQALDRVAQFYVDMAESIFPVVEIDVGRKVDLVLTEGLKMAPVDVAEIE